MNKLYKIPVTTLKEVDKTFEALFGFGFVFTSNKRLNTLESVKEIFIDLERGHWMWIVFGYDEDCQMVFGTSSAYDGDINYFTTITLDEFLEEKCCCPRAWAELKKTTDISVLRKNDEGEPIELVQFNPWRC